MKYKNFKVQINHCLDICEFWLSEKLLRYYKKTAKYKNSVNTSKVKKYIFKKIHAIGTFWISLSHHYSRFTLFGFVVTRLLNSNDSLNFSLNFFFPHRCCHCRYRVHLVSHNYRFNGSTGPSWMGWRKRWKYGKDLKIKFTRVMVYIVYKHINLMMEEKMV